VDKDDVKKDFKKKFEKYSKDKEATAKLIKDFLEAANPTAKELLDVLKSFAEAQKAGSAQFLTMINDTISILRGELERNELDNTQRESINDRITNLLLMARDEARENRAFNEKMGKYALGVGFLAIGGVVLIATNGKNKKVIQQGIELFAKK
jgi:predicted NBD/HSP70 family sugar kinase